MNYFLSIYQHLPGKINPVAFSAGPFFVRWYPLMYILAFLVVYLLLMYRVKSKEFPISNFQFPNKFKIQNSKFKILVEEFIFYSFLGVIIGGRLGYILFYNLPHYLAHPLEAFFPIQDLGYGFQVTGFYGMSYHGGLIGVLLATWYFVRKNKINFWAWADFVIPAVPAGFFFGRIGNFLNGELYGRITTKAWGMYFPAGGEMLRHPSQLYEAFFEGLVLFAILWFLRSRPHPASQGESALSQFWERGLGGEGKRGRLFLLYVFLYGLFRIFVEFFREPDPQLGLVVKWAGNGLTLGQILSLGMVLFSVCLFLYPVRSKNKKS
ncbi:MAG TPA: prolipoprotein diacylglyceryl transferase [Patescibacteria group bacterium]